MRNINVAGLFYSLKFKSVVFTYLNSKKINKNDQKLLELRKRAVKEKTKLLETKEAKENSDTQTAKSMVRLEISISYMTQQKLWSLYIHGSDLSGQTSIFDVVFVYPSLF